MHLGGPSNLIAIQLTKVAIVCEWNKSHSKHAAYFSSFERHNNKKY
jgi:hypothetical protein